MRVSSSTILDGKAILYTLVGEFDPNKVVAAARARYKDERIVQVALYLWDIRGLDLPESPELRDSTRSMTEVRSAQSDGRPAFIVVDRFGSAQYGMARMWQNTFSFPMEIFDSMEDAIKRAESVVAGN